MKHILLKQAILIERTTGKWAKNHSNHGNNVKKCIKLKVITVLQKNCQLVFQLFMYNLTINNIVKLKKAQKLGVTILLKKIMGIKV